ncbi:hypothetical protein FRC03_003928, partial [Tulasnella sp. 419]
QPLPGIDDHLQFWTTYDRVAGAYDRELLDGWNKSLDVLLIFAGLFSAINTAFIIESYRGLQADPAEITNALLRLLILHRNDNVTLSVNDLNPGVPSPSSFPINSLFFSSLSFSLTAAFGAVTAKQWLTEYNNVGATKALHLQGRLRQRKFKGLKTWHLRFIIELLPMLLQASLLLFLVGVVHFLWTLDRRVATFQLVLSVTGIAIYLVTIVIGIFVQDSPFQTPLSKYLPSYFLKMRRVIGRISSTLGSWSQDGKNSSWFRALEKVAEDASKAAALQTIRLFTLRLLERVKKMIRHSVPKSGFGLEMPVDARMEWKPEDITAAEAVVWLLEQAEHPDITIIALDAVPRLPPDLLRGIVEKREDLMGRLESFHLTLLPPFSFGPSGKYDFPSWTRSWPTRAIISGMAVRHLGKARKFSPEDILGGPYAPKISLSTRSKADLEDPIEVAKFELRAALGFNAFQRYGALNVHNLDYILRSLHKNSGTFFPFETEFVDSRNASIGGTFVSSVSPFRIMMDDIIQFCCITPLNDDVTYSSDTSGFFSIIQQHLSGFQGQISRYALGYISLMLAAVCRCLPRAPGLSDVEEQRLKNLILSRLCEVDQGKHVLENVTLAISFLPIREDIDRLGLDVFRMLLHAMGDQFVPDYYGHHSLVANPRLPRGLLQLAKAYPEDRKLQTHIADILDHCGDSDWVIPVDGGPQDVIIHLLICTLSPGRESRLSLSPSGLLDMITRITDQGQFFRIFALLHSHGLHKQIARRLCESYLPFAPEFVGRMLRLRGNENYDSSVLLEVQIWLVAGSLANLILESQSLYESVLVFFNQILQEHEDMQWPAYFISEGIVSDIDGRWHSGPGGLQPLKYIDFRNLMPYQKAPSKSKSDESRKHTMQDMWSGEGLLLLWRISKQEVASGRLHASWDDSIFFEAPVTSAMKQYYISVWRSKHNGINWMLLREYFNTALDKTGYTLEKMERGFSAPRRQSLDSQSEPLHFVWNDMVDALSEIEDMLKMEDRRTYVDVSSNHCVVNLLTSIVRDTDHRDG